MLSFRWLKITRPWAPNNSTHYSNGILYKPLPSTLNAFAFSSAFVVVIILSKHKKNWTRNTLTWVEEDLGVGACGRRVSSNGWIILLLSKQIVEMKFTYHVLRAHSRHRGGVLRVWSRHREGVLRAHSCHCEGVLRAYRCHRERSGLL